LAHFDDLNRMFCGSYEPWTLNDLQSHILPAHGYTHSRYFFSLKIKFSPPFVFFLEVLLSFDKTQRELFLKFVTGSAVLPYGGLKALQPKIQVVKKENDSLPSVMT